MKYYTVVMRSSICYCCDLFDDELTDDFDEVIKFDTEEEASCKAEELRKRYKNDHFFVREYEE